MFASTSALRIATPALALLLGGCTVVKGLEVGFPTAFHTEHGQDVARRVCAACHSIDGIRAGGRAGAPPFTRIAMKYTASGLERELETIAEIGHYDMPAITLSLKERRDVVAYITSLQKPESGQ